MCGDGAVGTVADSQDGHGGVSSTFISEFRTNRQTDRPDRADRQNRDRPDNRQTEQKTDRQDRQIDR
uniref:Conserved domain protein n=1 Tax=Haemonchus contortus TaxID=6289 RepID=A0A7I4Y104_HAECO